MFLFYIFYFFVSFSISQTYSKIHLSTLLFSFFFISAIIFLLVKNSFFVLWIFPFYSVLFLFHGSNANNTDRHTSNDISSYLSQHILKVFSFLQHLCFFWVGLLKFILVSIFHLNTFYRGVNDIPYLSTHI